MLCLIDQSIKVYHHLINHSHSQNYVTIQQTVTTLQQIVITFSETVITLSEDIRGSKRYQRFVYRSTFQKVVPMIQGIVITIL
jgi:hypothetical protein